MDYQTLVNFLKTNDIPRNQIAHDLALLIVKSKMESGDSWRNIRNLC
jgi:hypothetical protein